LPLAQKLIVSRIYNTNLKNFNNSTVQGYIFDPGNFDDHKDYMYTGYINSLIYPSTNDTSSINNIGWDISHSRRLVNVLQILNNTKDILGYYFPDSVDISNFANQFIYKIYNNNYIFPLFSNYFDGTNGWFRVGYSNRLNFGYGPSDLSISAISGGYFFWYQFQPDMVIIMNSLYNMLHSKNISVINHLNNHYEKAQWANNSITNLPYRIQTLNLNIDSIPYLDSRSIKVLLSFYSSLYEVNNNNSSKDRHSNIIIYPNPSKSIIYISSRYNISEIIIYDLMGKIVFSEYYNKIFIEINISKLQNGIYIIKTFSDNKIIFNKFLKSF